MCTGLHTLHRRGATAAELFALDIDDPSLIDHLSDSLSLKEEADKKRGSPECQPSRPRFSIQMCVLAQVDWRRCARSSRNIRIKCSSRGSSESRPRSLTSNSLAQIKRAGFRSLFCGARSVIGGSVHSDAYETLLSFLENEREAKRLGKSRSPLTERGRVTGFVAMGLPDDNMDELVNTTLN